MLKFREKNIRRIFGRGFIQGFGASLFFSKPQHFFYDKTSEQHVAESWERVGQSIFCAIRRYDKKSQQQYR